MAVCLPGWLLAAVFASWGAECTESKRDGWSHVAIDVWRCWWGPVRKQTHYVKMFET